MVTSPQVWTLIGVLATALIALVTLGIASIRQMFDAMNRRFDDLRSETNGRFDALRSEMTGRFDRLDGDVQALTNRVFRDG